MSDPLHPEEVKRNSEPEINLGKASDAPLPPQGPYYGPVPPVQPYGGYSPTQPPSQHPGGEPVGYHPTSSASIPPPGYNSGYQPGFYQGGYSQNPAYPQVGYGRPPGDPRKFNVLAIVAFCFALGGIFTYWFVIATALAAVIMGHISLTQIKHRGERGRGLAITALVVGYVFIGLFALIIIGIAATDPSTSDSYDNSYYGI